MRSWIQIESPILHSWVSRQLKTDFHTQTCCVCVGESWWDWADSGEVVAAYCKTRNQLEFNLNSSPTLISLGFNLSSTLQDEFKLNAISRCVISYPRQPWMNWGESENSQQSLLLARGWWMCFLSYPPATASGAQVCWFVVLNYTLWAAPTALEVHWRVCWLFPLLLRS